MRSKIWRYCERKKSSRKANPLNLPNLADYRFARVTICVGLTKRSAISSQISVVIM